MTRTNSLVEGAKELVSNVSNGVQNLATNAGNLVNSAFQATNRPEIQQSLSQIKSFFTKALDSLGIDDFKKFGESHGEEQFTKLLDEYAQCPEVKQQVARVEKLVKDGVLSEDLGEAFIQKITGATQVANSRDHRSLVPLADATRTLDLIESKAKTMPHDELSLRIRLSFDRGGMAAITGQSFDKDITTVIANKAFDSASLNASPDELWSKYRVRILEMATSSPEEVLSYLGQEGLKKNPARWQGAIKDIEAEQQVLRKLFTPYVEREEQERRQRSAEVYEQQSRVRELGKPGGFDELLSFISKGEGGYNSMNQGTRGGQIVGSTHNASTILGRNLTEMTIGQIMNEQASGRLFAAGRYQIIPDTMKFALKSSGLSASDQFSPENQDKLAIALIMYKRPVINEYLKGGSVGLDEAMLHLAMEWASMPDPRTGNSYYGSGNKALHSVEEVRRAMLAARASLSA